MGRLLRFLADLFFEPQPQLDPRPQWQLEGEYKIPACGCCPNCLDMGYAFGLLGARREDLLKQYYPIDGAYEMPLDAPPPKRFLRISPGSASPTPANAPANTPAKAPANTPAEAPVTDIPADTPAEAPVKAPAKVIPFRRTR